MQHGLTHAACSGNHTRHLEAGSTQPASQFHGTSGHPVRVLPRTDPTHAFQFRRAACMRAPRVTGPSQPLMPRYQRSVRQVALTQAKLSYPSKCARLRTALPACGLASVRSFRTALHNVHTRPWLAPLEGYCTSLEVQSRPCLFYRARSQPSCTRVVEASKAASGLWSGRQVRSLVTRHVL